MSGIFIKSDGKRSGFTLIEILLVIGMIGVMLAVILPRAFRARVDTEVNMVRQSAAELGRWGMTWAERNLEGQDETDYCRLNNYVYSLLGFTGDQTVGNNGNNWVGINENNNNSRTPYTHDAWDEGSFADNCRGTTSPDDDIAYAVEEIMSPERLPRNPFNGVSYFEPPNDGAIQPGALCLIVYTAAGIQNYYFVFQGPASDAVNEWAAGMGSGLNLSSAEARNGIFVARLAED